MIEFRTLSKMDMVKIRDWREQVPFALRTPRSLTREQQMEFYENVVCNRDANAYYWAIYHEGVLIGQAGIEKIEWTNRRGEISLLLNPEVQGRGFGRAALDELLRKSFEELNLDNIYGECYFCNPAIGFWERMVERNFGDSVILPNTKFWNGAYFDSYWFNFFLSNTNS